MELDETTKSNLVKLVAMRKLERELTKNFHFFGGDDRMRVSLISSQIPANVLAIVDEIIDGMPKKDIPT